MQMGPGIALAILMTLIRDMGQRPFSLRVREAVLGKVGRCYLCKRTRPGVIGKQNTIIGTPHHIAGRQATVTDILQLLHTDSYRDIHRSASHGIGRTS